MDLPIMHYENREITHTGQTLHPVISCAVTLQLVHDITQTQRISSAHSHMWASGTRVWSGILYCMSATVYCTVRYTKLCSVVRVIGGPCEAFFEWGGGKTQRSGVPPHSKKAELRTLERDRGTRTRFRVRRPDCGLAWVYVSARQYLTPYKICVRMAHPGAFFKKTRVDQ